MKRSWIVWVFLFTAVLFSRPAMAADEAGDFVQDLEKKLNELSENKSPSPVPSQPSPVQAVQPSQGPEAAASTAPAQAAVQEPPTTVPVEEQTTPPQAPAAAPVAASQEETAAKDPERPNRVVDVEIRGNKIVSTSTIMSKLKTQKGEVLLQETINEDLKRLYATGFFEDIQMELEENPAGYKLIVDVVEKPIIKHIEFEGFSIFKEDKLRKELKVIEGQILDRKAVQEGVEAIRKLYADKGFRFVEVTPTIDINEENKESTVKIRIIEGEKYKIKSIEFEGVKAFKPQVLRKLMKTKKHKLIFSGVFKEAVFEKDLEKVQLYYQKEGYLDVKVVPRFEYDKKAKQIFIILTVSEGQHYATGEVTIRGNKLFPESEIWQQLEMLPGLTYSQYYLSKDIENIRNYYYERGYVDARIVPDIRLNRDSGKVDVTYQIEEGDLYFVDKVVVRGNTKTKDIVIRRELRIRPGEAFDGTKIQKSKQRLDNLGFFDEVTYDTEPSQTASNRKDLVFRVKEKRTGELSFGGGISSVDRFVGFAEIAQRNFDLFNWPRFTGAGQSLSVRARVGSISQDYNVSFVEPYLFNKPVSFGTDLYNTRRDDKNVDFSENRMGAGATLSKLFRDVFRLGTGYTFERVKLDDIPDSAPDAVRDFAGPDWLSRMRLFASYDNRDNVFNPTKGMLISFTSELIGTFLGGDQDYYILQASASKYWSFFKKHILEARLRLGTGQEVGSTKNVPVYDRFFAGGLGTVRGYNYRRVGPKENGNSIGGNSMTIVNLEYTFPIFGFEAFRGAAFVDAGEIDKDSYRMGFGDFVLSAGPGFKIKTPIGPVALYYGFPFANRDTKDKNGRFEFSLSRGF